MNKLTLEKIGELAGVSRSTVSRVINHQASVKPEVRERVLAVVNETGYQPDPAARSLASHRSGIIGLIIPQRAQTLFTDPYFAHLIQGISQACNTHDYILSLFMFHSDEDEEKFRPRISRKQLFDGVIVTASQIVDPLVSQLIANKVPFVLNGRHDDPSVNFVDADSLQGAYTAVKHLIGLGHRRIATITGPMTNLAAVDRKQGYLNALQEHGYPLDERLITTGNYSEAGGFEAMHRLLPQRPDAVFVASDTMALGAIRALHSVGMTVPAEVAVVGFDDMPSAATFSPPLTTIAQPIQRIGRVAVETLIDILQTNLEPARRIVIPTHLVVRDSCGAGQLP